MLHSDVEARIGAHLIFSILLFPSSFHTNEISSLRCRYLGQHNKRHSHAASVSASASITALLEKLCRNRNTKAENHGNIVHDQERDIVAEDWKQGCGLKNSPNFYKLTSIIDKEPYVMKLTEDQMAQLLSAFWIQANLPDNLPSNIEAIAHSFILTLTVLRIKNLKDRDSLVIRFFQLPLSLWTMLLDQSNGILSPACQRSVYVLSAGMLSFACKIYQIPDLNDVFASLPMSGVDPSNSAGEDDTISEASVSDLSRFIPKMPLSPSAPHVISIGQLMESALEVAGQVAGTAISTSPLPYNTMASQCESLGTCVRKKLSNWLAFENHYSQTPDDKSFLAIADIRNSASEKVTNGGGHAQLPRDPMKLPPASPFDNFLKAAGC
ncbi:uncharacterized protein LOC114402074 [Glycine soja]|uniref:uncharacterized protein LOC114402074 n=1 Tax=Glycine soja TaxID=3848 RepID=UPI00103C64FA|nr:uncharacterized protein LOC114402074 [Glycine soja]